MKSLKQQWTAGWVVALLGSALAASPASASDHRRHDSGHRGHQRHEGHAHRSKGHVDINVGYGYGGGARHQLHHRRSFPRRVLVSEGHYAKRWIPPVTEVRYDECGRSYTVVIREGCYEKVWIAPRYVTRYVHHLPHYNRRRHRRHQGHRDGFHVSGHFRF